ncbi:MAG TPA: TetR/AcrR family transcriptional regulator [Candidatus Limnocylindria bacterium]|nr:TetR/AcrR family transcriptional regulator [Candidatus Limnocylindria bacterium]
MEAESSPRSRIIAGARQHFLAHGFRGVTMDDLAAELGMSKKTLYASFSSKTELLEAVLLDKFHDVETDLERITSADSSEFLTALHQLLVCLQGHMGEIQPPFIRDIRREAPEMFQLIESRRREIIRRYFGKIMKEGRKARLIRKDIPVNLIIEILLGAVQAIMNPRKIEELGLTPKTGFMAITRIVLEGAITRKRKTKSS